MAKQNMIIDKKMLSQHFKISIAKIDNMMKEGMPYFKIGKCVRFYLDEVEEWLKAGDANAKSK